MMHAAAKDSTFGRVARTVETGLLPFTWSWRVEWNLANADGRRTGSRRGIAFSRDAATRKADVVYGPLRDELYESEANA